MTAAKETDLADDVAALKRDLAHLIENVKKTSKGTANDVYRNIAAESERSIKAVSRQVEEQPLMSLLIAFGVGLVGGRLLSR